MACRKNQSKEQSTGASAVHTTAYRIVQRLVPNEANKSDISHKIFSLGNASRLAIEPTTERSVRYLPCGLSSGSLMGIDGMYRSLSWKA